MMDLRNVRQWILSCLLVGCFALPTSLFAQKGAPSLEAVVEQRHVPVGSYFEVSFQLKNGDGQSFRPPAFQGFKKMAGPSTSSSITIINGKYSQSIGWSYTLQAIQPGTFVIGAASVTVGGKTIQSEPIEIEVVAGNTNRSPSKTNAAPGVGGNNDIFVATQITNDNMWLGEQTIVNFVLYTRLGVESYDVLLEPNFQGFFAKELTRFDTRTREETVRGQRYALRTLRSFALFPQQTGNLTIESMHFQFAVTVGGASNDPISAFFGRNTQPVVVQSQPATIKVKSLPDPAPANFCGGVGKYQWTVEGDKTNLSTDNALTLSIAIRGNGDGKRFSVPKLVLPPELEAYDPQIKEEETYENGEELVHSQTIEYAIIPKMPGEFTFRPEFVYFDTDSARYVVKKSPKPIQMSVTQGKQGNPLAKNGSSGTHDISPLRPSASWSPMGATWFYSAFFWLLLLLPVLGLGGYWFWQKRQQQLALEIAGSPVLRSKIQSDAARERLSHARKLLQSGDARGFYDELSKSLQGFLSAKFDLPLADFSRYRIQEKMANQGVPPDTISTVSEVLQACEMALFAGQANTANMEKIYQKAEDSVRAMSREG